MTKIWMLTGTLIVDKSVALRENVDTSIVDISDLSGIKFRLTAKEDIIDYADGSVIYKKGQEVKVFNVDKEGNYTLDNLPMGSYELEEIKTLNGLALNKEKYEVKFTQNDLITKVYEETKDIKNDTTLVEFSKTDITGQEELVGAELTVLDEKGNIIDKWVSTEKSHSIEGLVAGNKYILREEIAPDGYVQSTDIEFVVEDTKEIQKVEMIDKVVEITKTDIAGEELEGATLVVTSTKTKNIVDQWVSTKEHHKVSGLIEGQTYILHEEIAIDGYVKASDIEFTVSLDKETQKVEMIDKIVSIKKTDLVTGEEIEGAELYVIDEENNIIDEWTSTKEEHYVSGLEEGKHYTLVEKTCPYGYEIADSIDFTVSFDKETQLVEMKDMPILTDVKLVKINSKTKEIIKDKFTFGIYEDNNCTKLIKEVESDSENGIVLFEDLRYGEYYIKELKAPKGYELSDKIIKLEINDKGVFIDGTKVEMENELYSFNFENAPIETPNTGDNRNTYLYLGAFVIAGLGLSTLVIINRKRKNK